LRPARKSGKGKSPRATRVDETQKGLDGGSMLGEGAARRRGLTLVGLATLVWSSAGVFAHLLNHLDIWLVLCGRAFFGAFFSALAAIVQARRGELGPGFGLGSWLSPLISVLAALAMTTYIAAMRLTTVAEVMVIYATLPFVTAGLAFLLARERAPIRTLAAAALALAGVVVMVGGAVGTGRLGGQALSFVMTFCFGLMVALQRRNPGMSLTTITTVGSLIAGLFAFFEAPRQAVGTSDLALMALFGFATISVAFLMFTEGAQHIPAAESALISMLDVVLGPFWMFLFFAEKPGLAAISGGALVLFAVVWRIAPDLWRARRG
jgi:drug/metabolite transporter (DMT)-like permease